MLSAGEIAELVGGELEGDPQTRITGISGIREAQPGDITFLANPRYAVHLSTTQAAAVIVGRNIRSNGKTLIRTDDPYVAFVKVMKLLNGDDAPPRRGVHPSAVVAEGVKLGKDVYVGPCCVLEEEAEIGDGTQLIAQVYVGRKTTIGKDCLIYPNVTIREKIRIGNRVIIHSGTVIGGDGFGFAPVKGVHHKVPQIGKVVIHDDVEIGSNVTIDRATIGETVIGKGTKIDNLVQIAHNVVIGENSIIVAQCGISGSARIGNNVTLAGQSGVVGHVTVGDNTIVAARGGVTSDVAPGSVVSGFPAKPHMEEKRILACLTRLPKLFQRVLRLEKAVEELSRKS